MAEEEIKNEEAKEAAAEAAAPRETPAPSVESKSAGATGDAENPAGESEKPEEPAKPAEPDWKDLYARLLADFDNYKKRAARDREDAYRYAEADILKDVLATVDNLKRALDNAGDKAEDDFVKGVKIVYDSLLKTLKEHGAEPFDSVGKALDTDLMEAIATLPSDEVEEGLVSIESKRGWMMRDRVLRPAQVVVSSGKA